MLDFEAKANSLTEIGLFTTHNIIDFEILIDENKNIKCPDCNEELTYLYTVKKLYCKNHGLIDAK